MGILRFKSLTAMMIPWAMTSHLIIPPKILTRIAWTWGKKRKETSSKTECWRAQRGELHRASTVSCLKPWTAFETWHLLTLLSEVMSLKASVTWWAVAPPPTSRKLAGVPPWSLMMSMVAMARPAPFTKTDKATGQMIQADDFLLLHWICTGKKNPKHSLIIRLTLNGNALHINHN